MESGLVGEAKEPPTDCATGTGFAAEGVAPFTCEKFTDNPPAGETTAVFPEPLIVVEIGLDVVPTCMPEESTLTCFCICLEPFVTASNVMLEPLGPAACQSASA